MFALCFTVCMPSATKLDFHWILPAKLAQGSYPEPPIAAFGPFDTVVFAAEELQPKLRALPRNKQAVFVPMDDDPYRPIPKPAEARILDVGRALAEEVQAGRRVLVTCAMGANRSGILTGATLIALGYPGKEAVRLIRERRHLGGNEKALFNPVFRAFVAAR
jgi:protein-tyrosine phosphatase